MCQPVCVWGGTGVYMSPSASGCSPGKTGTLSGPDHPSLLSFRLRPYTMIQVGGSRDQANFLWDPKPRVILREEPEPPRANLGLPRAFSWTRWPGLSCPVYLGLGAQPPSPIFPGVLPRTQGSRVFPAADVGTWVGVWAGGLGSGLALPQLAV